MELILLGFYCVFVFGFLFLAFYAIHLTRKVKQLQKQLLEKKDRSNSIELDEFLMDLMSGQGLISISRVDPSGLFQYSPRDLRR